MKINFLNFMFVFILNPNFNFKIIIPIKIPNFVINQFNYTLHKNPQPILKFTKNIFNQNPKNRCLITFSISKHFLYKFFANFLYPKKVI